MSVSELSYSEAIRAALTRALADDPEVFLMGEDIGTYGGAFGVTRGLIDKFGPARIIETPISEAGFVGLATGAAMLGARPVVEIMFSDFLILAFDQLFNHAAKFRYMYGDQVSVPMVIRTPTGAGRGYGPTHSQSVEAYLMHTPGLKVVCPSTPQDAYSLLLAAIADNNPVVFLESKLLYAAKGQVDTELEIPLGRSTVLREGTDVTVVTYSRMVHQALRAADELAADGPAIEVIDLRTLVPLDEETVRTSVEKTGRVILVEEGTRSCGVAAELAARIFENSFDMLDAPVKRLTFPDTPVPASMTLESAALPDAEKIMRAARELVAGED